MGTQRGFLTDGDTRRGAEDRPSLSRPAQCYGGGADGLNGRVNKPTSIRQIFIYVVHPGSCCLRFREVRQASRRALRRRSRGGLGSSIKLRLSGNRQVPGLFLRSFSSHRGGSRESCASGNNHVFAKHGYVFPYLFRRGAACHRLGVSASGNIESRSESSRRRGPATSTTGSLDH